MSKLPHWQRRLLAFLTYLMALPVVAGMAFLVVLFLAGPHAGLLSSWLEGMVLAAGWLAVAVLPFLTARWVWLRTAPRQ